MTKREPFAKIIRYPESEGLCLYVGGELVADSAYVEFTPEIITYLCEKINDAHEARVKEEIGKAVEEYKNTLKNLCDRCDMREKDHCKRSNPDLIHAYFCIKAHHDFKPEDKK